MLIPYHSLLQLAFRAAAFKLYFLLVRVAWPRLAPSFLSSASATDRPPREACRAKTATAMRSARTRCFPSCMTPGLCSCGRMGIDCADTFGACMGSLV
jgi:hypothetical protein